MWNAQMSISLSRRSLTNMCQLHSLPAPYSEHTSTMTTGSRSDNIHTTLYRARDVPKRQNSAAT